MTIRLSDVRFVHGSQRDVERGLLAYARVALGPYKIDGIAVRRTLEGTLAISYPKRTAEDGTAHTYFLPTDPEVRAALEGEILARYRQHEEGRS